MQNGQVGFVPKEALQDGSPIQAGDAFYVNDDGSFTRVSPEHLDPAERQLIEDIKAAAKIEECGNSPVGHEPFHADRDESHCAHCGTYMRRVPGPEQAAAELSGNPVEYFRQRFADAAGVEKGDRTMQDLLRAFHLTLAPKQQAIMQDLYEYTNGCTHTDMQNPLGHNDRRVGDPGYVEQEVAIGYTLTMFGSTLKTHRFWSQTVSGCVDLMANFLRENLSAREASYTFLVAPGRPPSHRPQPE